MIQEYRSVDILGKLFLPVFRKNISVDVVFQTPSLCRQSRDSVAEQSFSQSQMRRMVAE
jgi:hypothetical protein